MKKYLSLILFGLGSGVAACSSLLGIEDLSTEGGPPGGSGGNNGTAGSVGTAGIAGATGGGVVAGTGGEATGGSAGSSVGTGGAMQDSGATDGVAADVATGPMTVHGHVMDLWRRPVANAPVTIGATMTTTDAMGAFSAAAITAPYDVGVIVKITTNFGIHTQGWLYKGLHRADPTIQVYQASDDRSGSFHTLLSGVTFGADTQQVEIGFGSPDGAFGFTQDVTEVTQLSSAVWSGPATTTGTVHALAWTHTGTSDYDPPSAYNAYGTKAAAIDESNYPPAIALSLSNAAIASGRITGTATGAASPDRQNDAFVQFSDNAILHLLTDTTTINSFSYLVPQLANGTVSVSAQSGDVYGVLPFALAHKDKLLPGAQGVALAIPTPPLLMTPVDGATGNNTTPLKWSVTPSGVSLVRIRLDDTDLHTIYVATVDTSTQIPTFNDAVLQLKANAMGNWIVQKHGSYATIDDATGASGMLDSFYTFTLWGPVRDSGTYARSDMRKITFVP